jgi:hypothetical protein
MEKGHVEFSINWKWEVFHCEVFIFPESPEVHISPVSNGKITPRHPAGHVSAAGLGLSGFPGRQEMDLPSGKLTFSYGKSPFSMGKSTINLNDNFQ